MKKIAIPVASEKLCPHFGHCEQFVVYEVDNTNIVKEAYLNPPPHEPGVLPEFLAENDVTDVIAGGMGQRAIQLLNHHNINVYVGVDSRPPKTIVTEFLKGELESNPNLCDH